MGEIDAIKISFAWNEDEHIKQSPPPYGEGDACVDGDIWECALLEIMRQGLYPEILEHYGVICIKTP